MKKTLILIPLLIITAALLLGGSTRYSAYLDPDSDRPPDWHRGTYLGYGLFAPPHTLYGYHTLMQEQERLSLDPQQLRKIEEAALVYKQFYILHSARIKIQELELLHLLREASPDRKRVNEELQKLGKMKIDLVIRHLEYLVDLRELLTEKQRVLLKGTE